ncbi:uncharacterized protein LOC131940085 isoform X2 [Physella acuta]|uniref:uncharacterized protein LOC131940085 isoform X2 n=1 Tax=Physella acuta TaxID=109671 RepID=UPI0027DD097D|nr:uncharacterized protein LOC131940085 isoform X2 [Physella acuta]
MGSPLSKNYKCGTEQIHTRGLSFPDQPGVSGLMDIDTLECKYDNIQKTITEKADASDVAELKQTVEELKMAMNVLNEQDDNRTKKISCLTKLTTDCQANVSMILGGNLQQQKNISQLTSTQAETDRLIKNLGKVVERNFQEGEEIKSRVQRLEESQDKASNNIASLAAAVDLFVTAVNNRGQYREKEFVTTTTRCGARIKARWTCR